MSRVLPAAIMSRSYPFNSPRSRPGFARALTTHSERRLRRRNPFGGEARRSAPLGARRLSEGAVEAPSEALIRLLAKERGDVVVGVGERVVGLGAHVGGEPPTPGCRGAGLGA